MIEDIYRKPDPPPTMWVQAESGWMLIVIVDGKAWAYRDPEADMPWVGIEAMREVEP